MEGSNFYLIVTEIKNKIILESNWKNLRTDSEIS